MLFCFLSALFLQMLHATGGKDEPNIIWYAEIVMDINYSTEVKPVMTAIVETNVIVFFFFMGRVNVHDH